MISQMMIKNRITDQTGDDDDNEYLEDLLALKALILIAEQNRTLLI